MVSEKTDAGVISAMSEQLAEAMVHKTDDVLKEAITRFLDSDAWTLADLQGRCIMQYFPDGREVFCVDEVAVLELYPVEFVKEYTGHSEFFKATRRHRFLVPERR